MLSVRRPGQPVRATANAPEIAYDEALVAKVIANSQPPLGESEVELLKRYLTGAKNLLEPCKVEVAALLKEIEAELVKLAQASVRTLVAAVSAAAASEAADVQEQAPVASLGLDAWRQKISQRLNALIKKAGSGRSQPLVDVGMRFADYSDSFMCRLAVQESALRGHPGREALRKLNEQMRLLAEKDVEQTAALAAQTAEIARLNAALRLLEGAQSEQTRGFLEESARMAGELSVARSQLAQAAIELAAAKGQTAVSEGERLRLLAELRRASEQMTSMQAAGAREERLTVVSTAQSSARVAQPAAEGWSKALRDSRVGLDAQSKTGSVRRSSIRSVAPSTRQFGVFKPDQAGAPAAYLDRSCSTWKINEQIDFLSKYIYSSDHMQVLHITTIAMGAAEVEGVHSSVPNKENFVAAARRAHSELDRIDNNFDSDCCFAELQKLCQAFWYEQSNVAAFLSSLEALLKTWKEKPSTEKDPNHALNVKALELIEAIQGALANIDKSNVKPNMRDGFPGLNARTQEEFIEAWRNALSPDLRPKNRKLWVAKMTALGLWMSPKQEILGVIPPMQDDASYAPYLVLLNRMGEWREKLRELTPEAPRPVARVG